MIRTISGDRRFLVLAIALLALEGGSAIAATTLRPGEIDAAGTLRGVTIAPDCRVHIVTATAVETVEGCGRPLTLPSGATTVWLEQGNAISGQVALPLEAEEVTLPLVPAAEVSLSSARKAEAGDRIRVIHAGTTRFARDLGASELPRQIRVPAGPAVALHLDKSGDVRTIATGRPVPAGPRTALRMEPPAEGATAVAIFGVPERVEKSGQGEAPSHTFLLGAGDAAGMVIDRGDEILALWQGMAAGPSELTVRSDAYQHAPVPLRLRERNIATVRGALRPLPDLTVVANIPEDARPEWLALEPAIAVRRVADRNTVRRIAASLTQEFPLLPADLYEVVLETKPWVFVRRADLSAGQDATVELFLKPITIEGQVTVGEEPAPASITFRRSGGDAETVHTDAEANYSITLWAAGMYLIETTLDAAEPRWPAYSKLFRLSSSRELDIRVPRTDLVVLVTDAATNSPVANAQVNTFNSWTDPVTGNTRGSHTITTDSAGRARLAPMNPGTAEIEVTADGYFKSDQVSMPVEENAPARVVEVKLRSAADTVPVRITLPDGAPAAGAEVIAVADTTGDRVLWSGSADPGGVVRVPRALAQALVLVSHPSAAGMARRIQALAGQEYQLPPRSQQAVVVHVERNGVTAHYGAMTVWFDGIPLTWSALQFLTRTPPNVMPNGSWTGSNLPAGPVRLLASTGAIDAAIAAGAYDALATVVPEPRPERVVVKSVD